MGVNSLPKTVTRQATASRLRSEPRTFCAWVQHANHSTTEPLQDVRRMLKSTESVCTWACWRLTEGLAGLGRSERGLSCRCNCFLYCTIIHRIHTTHYTSQRRQRPCCWVREWKKLKSVNIWQSYKQERGCLMHFARRANTLLKDEESARDNHVLACNFAKYSPI